jgi:hypothetical protein
MFEMLPQLKYLDNADKEGGKSEKQIERFFNLRLI